MIVLSPALSERALALVSEHEVHAWLQDVAAELGGVSWRALGGIPNNVHTVEVASDPALALVERPINGIDALLDLAARERDETAPNPHEAARRWFDVSAGGLAKMSQRARAALASRLRVSMTESGDAARPTITIQDAGTGQHPDDFDTTLLSLLASNKKSKTHQMGVYNAGGAASCRFARYTIVASRLAPSLLDGRDDEVGITVIRYNALDPDRFKSGTYEYLAARDGSILRLAVDDLAHAAAAIEHAEDPAAEDYAGMAHGTLVRLVEYQLSRYARAAHEPKQSLWHLLHAALPDPALPIRIVETRDDRFPGVRGVERRTVAGLLHLLSREGGVADYADIRPIDLGPDLGTITLRYFVLNEGTDPDAYTTSEQGLTITNNGQRQITKERAWLKRHLELPFLFKRLVVLVDGTGLTNATKREVFSSTRESGVDTPTTKRIIDRITTELREDENLAELDELQRQRVLQDATKSTTDKVKRQLARQISAYMRGELSGSKGGRGRRRRGGRRKGPVTPPPVDDSLMLDVPDRLALVEEAITIEPGGTTALRLEINAKNDFLPNHADGLSVVFGAELAGKVHIRTKGRLLGGRVRVTLEADADAPLTTDSFQVALVLPDLGVLLTATGQLEVAGPKKDEDDEGPAGGEPNIDVRWKGREGWAELEWDEETVGTCVIRREDPDDLKAITKVEWILNEAFVPYERVTAEKQLTETTAKSFKEGYEYPVLFGLFRQQLAREAAETAAEEEDDRASAIPDPYFRGEQARMARAVLMAMEPELAVAGYAEAA